VRDEALRLRQPLTGAVEVREAPDQEVDSARRGELRDELLLEQLLPPVRGERAFRRELVERRNAAGVDAARGRGEEEGARRREHRVIGDSSCDTVEEARQQHGLEREHVGRGGHAARSGAPEQAPRHSRPTGPVEESLGLEIEAPAGLLEVVPGDRLARPPQLCAGVRGHERALDVSAEQPAAPDDPREARRHVSIVAARSAG
jgi:hypothetical protein